MSILDQLKSRCSEVKLVERFEKLLLFLLALMVSVNFLIALLLPIHQDEAVFIVMAKSWANGYMPYRDIFDIKPPGIFMTGWLIYEMLRMELTAYRAVVLGLVLIQLWLIYRWIIINLDKESTVFIYVSFVSLSLIFQANYFLTEPFVSAFSLLSIITFSKWIKLRYKKWLVSTALLASGAFIFKIPAISLMLVQLIFIGRKRLWKELIMYLFFYALPIGVAMTYFYVNQALEPMLRAIIVEPMINYPPSQLNLTLTSFIQSNKLHVLLLIMGWFYFLKISRKNNVYKLLAGYSLLVSPWVFYRAYHHYWLLIVPVIVIGLTELYQKSSRKLRVGILTLMLISSFSHTAYNLVVGLPSSNAQREKVRRSTECANLREVYQYLYSDCPVPRELYQLQ